MNVTSQLRQCPQCGSELAANTPQGLCPKCLIAQAIEATVNPKLLARKMQLMLRFETKIIAVEEAGLQRRGQVLMLDASLLTGILVEKQVQKSAKLAAEGKYKKSIKEADIGLAFEERNLKLLTIRGTAYASTEQMEKAKVDLETVFEHDKDCPPELVHNLAGTAPGNS